MQVIKTDIIEKYQTLPMMIAEETGESIEYVVNPTSDNVWHYYFMDRISSIKPNTDVALKWDSKMFQYEQFKDKLKVPEHKIYENVFHLIKDLVWLYSNYGSFMVTTEHGVNGREYLKDPTREEVFKKYYTKGKLRASKFIPNAESVSLHLIVANHDEFYVSPVVKQHIEGISLYRGGSYPYDIEIDCSIISNALFESGYVGLAHVDFLIADDIYFGEINPRIAGSTPYISYSLEREFGINLPYLEYYAVQNNSLPTINDVRKCNIQWDFEIKRGNKPDGKWIDHLDIRQAFDKSGVYYIPFFSYLPTDDEYIRLEVLHDH